MLRKMYASGLQWLWITFIVLLIDRFAKMWVISHLTFLAPIAVLPFFNLTLAYNTGAAFSFLHTMSGWQNWVLGGLAGIISLSIFIWLAKTSARQRWLSIALCLILAGALGNAWDRILYGYVIDFLDFHLGDWHFAIFNIADSAITIGAIMLLISWFGPAKKNR